MTVLIGILGALLTGAVSGAATYVLSKREKGGINEEISEAQEDLERASSHLARIQRRAQTQTH
jgi:hypothetical protein